MYSIKGLCPVLRECGSGCGFSIDLWPKWRELVAFFNESRSMNQAAANTAVRSMHRPWLDGCGFSQMYDPDNCGAFRDTKRELGPNARHLYDEHAIRVQWGEWGPEHICVPGDACGLDLDRGIGAPRGGKSLLPHNVDSIAQAHLLLVVFTWFAETIVLNWEVEQRGLKL